MIALCVIIFAQFNIILSPYGQRQQRPAAQQEKTEAE